jgi:hypothetical protein
VGARPFFKSVAVATDFFGSTSGGALVQSVATATDIKDEGST